MRQKSWKVLFVLALLNFAIFTIVAILIGGDAVNGKVESGRYYLSNHGRFTEVSERVFRYSRVHAYSLIVTHPLALLAGFSLYRARRNRRTE